MPKFRISGPDGTWDVEGPDEAGAMAAFQQWKGIKPQQESGGLSDYIPGFISRAHEEGKQFMRDVGQSAEEQIGLPESSDSIHARLRPPIARQHEALKRAAGGPVGGVLGTTLGALGAYPTGFLTSLVGRELMAPGIHTVGELINPDEAAKHTSEDVFQKSKHDIAGGLATLGARGAPRINPSAPLRAASDIHTNTVTPQTNQIPVAKWEFDNLANDILVDWHQKNWRQANTGNAYDEIAKLRKPTVEDASELIAMREGLRGKSWDATGKEKTALLNAIEHITKKIETVAPQIVPELREADRLWSQGKQAEKVADTMGAARLRSEKGDYTTAVRDEFRKMDTTGMTDAEKAVAERIHKGTLTRNALQQIGRLDPTQSALMAIAHGGVGYASGGMNLPVAAGAFAARKLAGRLATKDANRLAELIQSRTPQTNRLSGPMQEWAVTAVKFESDPTPKNFARLTLASKNFSTNLADFGIRVSQSDLLRSLTGPATGRADGENEE